MSSTTLRFAVAFALLAFIGAPVAAEPRAFNGTIRLDFPGLPNPISWAIPVAGLGKYQPGTAASTEEAFVISNTVTVDVGTSTSVMGTVANPFFQGGSFDTGQIQSVKLGAGFASLAAPSSPLGFRVSIASLDLQGLSASGATMTFNHPLLRVGTNIFSYHPGASYWTNTSGPFSYSASASESTWVTTVNDLAYAGGNLNMVVPVVLNTADSGDGTLAFDAKLELTFAPEPTMGLALIAGAAAVFALGRRRRS